MTQNETFSPRETGAPATPKGAHHSPASPRNPTTDTSVAATDTSEPQRAASDAPAPASPAVSASPHASTPATAQGEPHRATAPASYPLISTATIATDRASRYGKQLVTHMAHKITGSWDGHTDTGYLLFDREGPVQGRFDVVASASALSIELRTLPECADRLESIVGIHLARFGARDSLAVSWRRADGSEGTSQGPLTPEEVEAHARAKKAAREAAGNK